MGLMASQEEDEAPERLLSLSVSLPSRKAAGGRSRNWLSLSQEEGPHWTRAPWPCAVGRPHPTTLRLL